ncbi:MULTISPECIES: hypothetical protein [Serratia]|jgi:hypothetical protein|uniref:hypothetical protein n=1 Tax=Serratia TaxID=613 RepID=UPI000C24CF0A|nr:MULTISPECIES: hypothetical protein [Serratia]ELI8813498.1 hypothetical protein [Serratia marcescens]ELI8843315.1 hypothetical protein [Serratia marcescens]MBN5208320.1 hypothetical protein [Serratia marcescens]MBN5384290.1 hypothetical protein [Serratia marcescens]PJI70362.1 hypothetical protein CUN64_03880 [Serratia sp. TKO39]
MKEFIEHITRSSVSDIIVTGYIDGETVPVFHPMYDRVYFISDETIFELYIDDDGIVNSRLVENIVPWFEVDEDDKFSMMSIYSQSFKTEQEVSIVGVNYSDDPFSGVFLKYKAGDDERLLSLESNNFFGFLIS